MTAVLQNPSQRFCHLESAGLPVIVMVPVQVLPDKEPGTLLGFQIDFPDVFSHYAQGEQQETAPHPK